MNAAPLFRVFLLLCLLILLVVPIPTQAQYIYVDVNGDGLNTPADVLGGLLPIKADIYLRTDRNRDGTSALCATGSQPLSIGSFEFILRATGGSVVWGAFSSTLFGGATRTAQNATDFYAGYFDSSTAFFPPGPVHLGSIQIPFLTGTPLLKFVASTPLSASYFTSFGSHCRGGDGDNTMKLGEDWQDADGTFGSLLANVSGTVFKDANGNCVMDPGEVGMPGWIATLNPLGQTVLSTRSGHYEFGNVPPGIYSVQVNHPSSWSQTCPPGGAPQPVTVLVGGIYSNLNFGLRPSNLSPVLDPVPDRSLVESQVTNQSLMGSDPEARPLQFSLVSGPAFASVTTTGAKTGNLHLAPKVGDAGTYVVKVAVSDGLFGAQRNTNVNVFTLTGVGGVKLGPLALSVTPNPLNPVGKLTFRTHRPGFVRVRLYDLGGRLVRTLQDSPMAPKGYHELTLDSRDDVGRPLASGVYFFKVETSEGSEVGHAILMK